MNCARLLLVKGPEAIETAPAFASSNFVKAGSILDVHGLKRAKYFVAKDGSFREARFRLEDNRSESDSGKGAWSWAVNPFVGTRELGGLKILAMLTSNWDTKD